MESQVIRMPGGLVSVRTAAEYLCLSRSKLYLLMDQGRLPYVQVDRSRRIPKAALEQFAIAHLVGGSESSLGDHTPVPYPLR